MTEDKLRDLKKKYLFDEQTGLIRGGITSMKHYAKIFYAESEEDLDKAILEIMEEQNGQEEEE